MYTITDYQELESVAESFTTGKLNLLVVVSAGGLGKTTTFTRGLKKADTPYHIITGHITPKKLYEEAYEHRDQTILIDDVDGLLRSGTIVALMKQMCDTIPRKTIQYNTTQPMTVPSIFRTSSKIVLLLNKVPLDNENIMAFLSRGIFVNFIPTPREIFRELKEFAKDKAIMAFIESKVKTLGSINFRVYKHAVELKKCKLNWEKYLLEEFKLRDEEEIAIQITETRKPYVERVQLWKAMTGKSQSTYDRIINDLGERELNSKLVAETEEEE